MRISRIPLTWLVRAVLMLFRCSNLIQKAGACVFAFGCLLLIAPSFFSHGSAHRAVDAVANYSAVALLAGVALALLSILLLLTPLVMTRSERLHSYLLRTRDEASDQERESAVALLERS